MQEVYFNIESVSQETEFIIQDKTQRVTLDVEGLYKYSTVILQNKSVTPTQSTQTITADAGYDGLDTVTVNPIPSNYGLITWNGSVLTVS